MAHASKAARTQVEPRSVAGVLSELGRVLENGAGKAFLPIPTGFEPLDHVLGGGLHAGELTIVGGPPGVGKTVATLQWARAIAKAGGTAIYACYEHDEAALLIRLLGLELGDLAVVKNGLQMDHLREGLQAVAQGETDFEEIVSSSEELRRAYLEVQSYADRLWLVRCSSSKTGVEALGEMTRQRKGTTALFVDYLQKVALKGGEATEQDRTTRLIEGLKDLALNEHVAVVSVVAGDADAISQRRLRMDNLSDTAALAYEADVALILNDKINAVSKVHLAYDTVRAKTFRDYVVFSIEKNRGGPAPLDLEFRKHFAYFAFDPHGGIVAERLVDDQLYRE